MFILVQYIRPVNIEFINRTVAFLVSIRLPALGRYWLIAFQFQLIFPFVTFKPLIVFKSKIIKGLYLNHRLSVMYNNVFPIPYIPVDYWSQSIVTQKEWKQRLTLNFRFRLSQVVNATHYLMIKNMVLYISTYRQVIILENQPGY